MPTRKTKLSVPKTIKIRGALYRLAEFDPDAPVQYKLNVTYSTVKWNDPESDDYEDEHGFVSEDVVYASLEELLRDLRYDHVWLEWSSYPPQPGDWIVSDSEENYKTGEHTQYGAHIEHADGSPLTTEEMGYLHQQLKLHGNVPVTVASRKANKMEQWKPKDPKSIVWGPDAWPTDDYLVFIKEKHGTEPPMSKEEYLALSDKRRELYGTLEQTKRKLKDLEVAQDAFRRDFLKLEDARKLNWDAPKEIQREWQDKQNTFKAKFEALANEQAKIKEQMEPISAELMDVLRDFAPVSRWLNQYDTRQSRLTHFSSTDKSKTLEHQGAGYRLAHPDLGPEYSIPVSAEQLDPEVILWFHSGQTDPIYALGSRLYAYGGTMASLEELEALRSVIEHHIVAQDDIEEADLDRIEAMLDQLNQMLKEI